MKTTIHEERLIVTSDTHLGNRLFPTRRHLADFIRYAYQNKFSLCLNGDGVDIVQMSLGRLTRELAECYTELRKFSDAGLKVYYIVGNHDIVVEHFLEDFGSIVTVPFLNLVSGDLRIRIDHGHMYDEMFLKFPRFYTAVMILGRWAISLSPQVYEKVEVANEALVATARRLTSKKNAEGDAADSEGIPGEHRSFREAAEEVALRGFDAVIFGHTHHPGRVVLRSGAVYYNTGSWLLKPRCVVIDRGTVWFGVTTDLLEGKARVPDPALLERSHAYGRTGVSDPRVAAEPPIHHARAATAQVKVDLGV